MIKSFQYIFFILILVVFISGLAWTSIYLWGLARPIFIYEAKWINEAKYFVAVQLLEDRVLLPQTYGIVFKLVLKNDVLLCGESLCSEWLPHLDNRAVLFELNENQMNIDQIFYNQMKSLAAHRKIGLISAYPGILQSIKKLFPAWIYSLSTVEEAKLKVFDALGLTHVPAIEGDFGVVDDLESLRSNRQVIQGKQNPKKYSKIALSTSIQNELRRRKKPLILDLRYNKKIQQGQSLGYDAALIEIADLELLKLAP